MSCFRGIPGTRSSPLFVRIRAATTVGEQIRKAMEDIPATSPVLLTLEHKMYLLRVLGEWSDAAGGYDAMPPGLFELRNALMDELRDAERRQATA